MCISASPKGRQTCADAPVCLLHGSITRTFYIYMTLMQCRSVLSMNAVDAAYWLVCECQIMCTTMHACIVVLSLAKCMFSL
jgi:hypothetical protein